MDTDALLAAVDLIGRSGGTSFEIGHHAQYDDDLNEIEGTVENMKWWAKAMYKGAMLSVDDYPSPDTAAMALCGRVLEGALCRYCKKLISLGWDHTAPDLPEEPRCRWTRMGNRYEPGCKPEAAPQGNRAHRRARERHTRKRT